MKCSTIARKLRKNNKADFSFFLTLFTEFCSYTESVQAIATLYRDRPMSAIDTATYWVEYVIRHKGAKHMRFAGVDLNIFEHNSMDVIAFILILLYLIVKSLVFVVRRLVGKFRKVDQKQKVN
jgi:glucuronosyltransferase